MSTSPKPCNRASRGGLRARLRRLPARIDPALRTTLTLALVPGLPLFLLAGLPQHAPIGPQHGLATLSSTIPPLPWLGPLPTGTVLHALGLLLLPWLIHRLVRLDELPSVADRAAWLTALAPTTILLWRHPNLVVTAALVLVTFFLMRRTHWGAAAASGTLLALWTPFGGLISVALIAHYLQIRGLSPAKWRPSILLLGLPVVAAAAVGIRESGQALGGVTTGLFATATPTAPWAVASDWFAEALARGVTSAEALAVITASVVLFFLVLGAGRLRPATHAFVIALILAGLIGGDPGALPVLGVFLLPLVLVPARLLESSSSIERVVLFLLSGGLVLALIAGGPLVGL